MHFGNTFWATSVSSISAAIHLSFFYLFLYKALLWCGKQTLGVLCKLLSWSMTTRIQCSLYLSALCFSHETYFLSNGLLLLAYKFCPCIIYHNKIFKCMYLDSLSSLFHCFSFFFFFWFLWEIWILCIAEAELIAAPVSSVISQGSLVSHLLFETYVIPWTSEKALKYALSPSWWIWSPISY